YNAHTTASDALWAGLPILTCMGRTFAGRVGASLVQAIGAPELIADSMEEYEVKALQLARDPVALAAIRRRIEEQKRTSPLFDTGGYPRNLEQAYVQMVNRHQRGEPPSGFAVVPSA